MNLALERKPGMVAANSIVPGDAPACSVPWSGNASRDAAGQEGGEYVTAIHWRKALMHGLITQQISLPNLAHLLGGHQELSGIAAVLIGEALVPIYCGGVPTTYDLDFMLFSGRKVQAPAMIRYGFERQCEHTFIHPHTPFEVTLLRATEKPVGEAGVGCWRQREVRKRIWQPVPAIAHAGRNRAAGRFPYPP